MGHSFGKRIQKEGYFTIGCRCKYYNLDSFHIYTIVISAYVCAQIMGKPIEIFTKQYEEVLPQEEEEEEDEEMDVDMSN